MNLKTTLSASAQSISKADKKIRLMIPRFDNRRIHQWRMDVKKIRSLVRIAQDSPASPVRLRLPRAVNNAYRLLGEIRDSQVVRTSIMATGWTDFPDFRDQFLTDVHRVILIQEAAFKKVTRNWKIHHRQECRFNRQLKHYLTAAAVRHFVHFRFNELEGLATAPVTDEEIHRLRSMVKDLLFNWSLLHRYKTAERLTADVQKIFGSIGLLTGEYLDLKLSIRRLENFIAGNSAATGRCEIPDFLTSWESEAENVKLRVLAFLPQLRQIFHEAPAAEPVRRRRKPFTDGLKKHST